MSIIGIDFGTIKSLVAIMEDGAPKIIPDCQGRRYVPSLVTVGPDDKMYIGWDALNLPSLERWGSRHFTISSIKRMLGKTGERTWGEYRTYPQEIASLIISQLKIQAEAYCGKEITRAVLAVPAHFNINERSATREAARVAGLSVERIIHEPTAAALAYGMAGGKSSRVAVFDLGGGTFDISILEIGDNVFEVLASGGDTTLGGVDLNEALLAHVIGEFQRATGIDLKQVVSAKGRLEEAVEQAKCELSFVREVPIKLPYIASASHGPKHLDMVITREKFEEIAEPIFDRLAAPCKQALTDAKLTVSDIQEVILVGASTRIPRVREIIKHIFCKEPGKSVNPDEVVALGAAVQGSILEGQARDDMLLLDVTPASLGVAMQGGVMNRLIERNTTIPTHKSEAFTTTRDNQTEVTIPILQGEQEFAKDNTLLGNVELTGIPPAPKDSAHIDVSFSIDANGTLEVSAKHAAAKREVSARFLAGPYSLNPAQIKVLRRKVDGVLESSRRKMLQHRARLLDEEMRREAEAFATALSRFLCKHADSMPGEHTPLLQAGVELIEAYIERGSSREDMDKLTASIRSTCQDAIRDSRICCDCHEDVLMQLLELIADKAGKPAIIPLMEVLGHSNSDVRHKALNALRPHRDRMQHPIRKIFTIAEKVLAQGEKASFWERRFLARMMRVRDDLVELLTLLRRRS